MEAYEEKAMELFSAVSTDEIAYDMCGDAPSVMAMDTNWSAILTFNVVLYCMIALCIVPLVAGSCLGCPVWFCGNCCSMINVTCV